MYIKIKEADPFPDKIFLVLCSLTYRNQGRPQSKHSNTGRGAPSKSMGLHDQFAGNE
jgi:hypothetical protein